MLKKHHPSSYTSPPVPPSWLTADFLTISPSLLEELKNDTAPVPKKLDSLQGTCKLHHGLSTTI